QERCGHLLEQAPSLDVKHLVTGHHDFGDLRITKVRLQWSVSEDVVRDLSSQSLGLLGCEVQPHASQNCRERSGHPTSEFLLRKPGVIESGAQQLQKLYGHG